MQNAIVKVRPGGDRAGPQTGQVVGELPIIQKQHPQQKYGPGQNTAGPRPRREDPSADHEGDGLPLTRKPDQGPHPYKKTHMIKPDLQSG